MEITKSQLDKAVRKKIINREQADKLMVFLQSLPSSEPTFNFTNTLYYFGGILAIGAMTIFMKLQWSALGDTGVLILLLCYTFLSLAFAHLFAKKKLTIPSGICATFTVCLIPFLTYILQKLFGWWPDNSQYFEYYQWVRWNWTMMEFTTLLAGIILLWIYRYPFMVMPIAITLWFMSMDLANLITGQYDFELATTVSICFGLAMIAIAFWVDIRTTTTKDYAFWLYIFGVITFWGGICGEFCDTDVGRLVFFLINIFMILFGVMLFRKVFVVFGAIGCIGYIGYLAFQVFQNSVFFPIALVLLGLGIIYIGIIWQKHEKILADGINHMLPLPMRKLIEKRHHSK